MNPATPIALFYDTETTGLPLFKEPSDDPRQPHIVQLGAALVNLESFEIISTLDVIVKPEGWTVPDDVAAIHGISTEKAEQVGVPAAEVYPLFVSMWRRAEVRIGHNEQFDARLVRIGLLRHLAANAGLHDEWKAGKAECTQVLATPLLKLPPTEKMLRAGFNKHKSANLGEAYEYFTGKPLDGAHSAMVDVLACLEVYRAIKEGRGKYQFTGEAEAVAA